MLISELVVPPIRLILYVSLPPSPSSVTMALIPFDRSFDLSRISEPQSIVWIVPW